MHWIQAWRLTFGCCTANMHQGWPKFTTHIWGRTLDGGLAALAYAPGVVETTVSGKPVRIETITEYPFRDEVTIKVILTEPMDLPLYVRIPSWSADANMLSRWLRPGTFTRVMANRWPAGTHEFPLRFPIPVTLYKGSIDAVAIERGPLVYSLKIDGEWKKLRGQDPYADWEVYPKSPWNYALAIDRERPGRSITFEERPVGDRPFSQDGAPVVAKVKGPRLPGWSLEKNAAAPPPRSPVASGQPLEDLTLIPYDCTDLRVTEFPTLAR